MRETLKNYYQKNRDSFEQNLKLAQVSNDMELIHELRLCVKRINALNSYLRFLAEKKSTQKGLKAFKSIYKPAGNLRDLQVELDLVHSYETRYNIKYTLYKAHLKSKENEANKKPGTGLARF